MILSIAGSDPSGGAGIQADLKTMAVLGVYGAAAMTCLTVQNTREVAAVAPVAPELVRKQIELVLADLPVTHVKIGMIGTAPVAQAIGAALAGFTGESSTTRCSGPRPVPTSSNRPPWPQSAPDYRPRHRAHPQPGGNGGLDRLGGAEPEEMLAAGRQLLADFPNMRALAIKGGHGPLQEGLVTDYLVHRSPGTDSPSCLPASRPWVETANSHGTGCTFASAFAAFHLFTGNDKQAFTRAAAFVHELLTASAGCRLGGGTGPLLHHLGR